MTYPHYAIWMDSRTSEYEVVRWDGPTSPTVVQTNIKTRAKATEALKIWQAREADKAK